MRIGIDIDGVCYKWVDTAMYMLREVLPNSPYKDDPAFSGSDKHSSWDYLIENITKKEHQWLWKEGIKNGLFRHGSLYPGTVTALHKLSEYGKLVAVTQRPHRVAKDTFDWIGYHGLPFEEVHILQGEPKSSVPWCEMFIDDKPENCMELQGVGTWAVMPDRPWNRTFDNYAHSVDRIYHWNRFIELVEAFNAT